MPSTPDHAVEPRRASPAIPAYRSLRVRLPLLLSALIAAAATAMLWGAHRELESTLLRAGGEHAVSASGQVASLLERSTQGADNVRRAAASPEIIEFLEQPTDEMRERARRRLSVLAVAGPRRIGLWNAAGEPLLDIWVPGPSVAASDPARLPGATRAPAAGFNDLQATPSGLVYADFGAEIHASHGSSAAPIGILATRSTLSITPANALSRLVGDDAVIGLGSPARGVWTDLSRVSPRPPVDLTRVGVTEYRTADGARSLGAVTLIRGTPWSVWVEFNRARILAPARTFLERMILIALLVVAVGALVVGRLTLRMTHPLYDLAYAADEVAAGDLTKRVTATGENEIGRLGRAFNEMVARVTLARRQLETQVVERDRALDALRESEAHYRAIIEVALDCVIAIDASGRVLEFNPAAEKTFGFPKADVLGRELADFLVPPAFRQAHRDALARNAAGGGGALIGQRVEMPALRADGTEVQIELAISVVPSAGPRTWIAVARDITERKRAEAVRLQNLAVEEQNRRILEANRLKGEFVANMSHELRTPLNAIIGFADLIHSGKAGPLSAVHEEYLGDILTSSRHLLQLINDVLDLAKVESGKMEFRPESVDTLALVEDVRTVLRGLAGSKRINVDVHVDPIVSGVVVDPVRVKQILYNFLSNAIKFTPDGGRVSVRVVPEGNDAFRIDVEDSGVGIRTEDLGRLFVEFEQLDSGIAKQYPGTGLGLALTKRLAEAHGGRVDVHSVTGQGSTFSAILPRTATKRALAAGRTFSAAPSGNRTVLVVEDDAGALKLAQLLLAERGYHPIGESSAEDGLRAAVAHAPALVIVDLLMPGVNGLEFVERLRALPEGRELPIVVWSVKDLEADERRRLESSRAEIVSKRGDGARALLEAVHRLLPITTVQVEQVHGR
jgi:PAS domain S-box-containing protein